MPELKIQSVVSFSSEHANYPVTNILSKDPTLKWLCSEAGESKVVVTLQLASVSHIKRVEIGNANSAIIEVLVGRSDAASSEPNTVLVVASSFMSPNEARRVLSSSDSAANSVRCFTKDKLTLASESQWDRIRVVCSQPFNKKLQYGLSFIKIYNVDSEDYNMDSGTIQTNIGPFQVHEEKDSLLPGRLFAMRKSLSGDLIHTTTTTVNESNVSAKLNSSAVINNQKQHSVKNKESVSSSHISSIRHNTKSRQSTLSESNKPSFSSDSANSKDKAAPLHSTASSLSSKQKNVNTGRHHSKPLAGVVFVLSGFVNPERADLREMACELGATYQPDWNKTCTHLICAYEKTPKYNEVQGRGRIVKADWLRQCQRRLTKVAWRPFRLGRATSPAAATPPNSSAEVEAEPLRPKRARVTPMYKSDSDDSFIVDSDKEDSDFIVASDVEEDDDDDDDEAEAAAADSEDEDTDKNKKDGGTKISNDIAASASSLSNQKKKQPSKAHLTSDSDDDDWSVVRRKGSARDVLNTSKTPCQNSSTVLPDLFHCARFLLSSDLDDIERRLLKRIVLAFNGRVDAYMGQEVAYIVTGCSWNDDFHEAFKCNANVKIVQSEWLFQCEKWLQVAPIHLFEITSQ